MRARIVYLFPFALGIAALAYVIYIVANAAVVHALDGALP